MSDTPPCSTPRRPLHERTPSQNNRLQIRVVPYSPPIINSDGEIASRPVSYADAGTETEAEPWQKGGPSLQPSSPAGHETSPSPELPRKKALRSVGTDSDLNLAARFASSPAFSAASPETEKNVSRPSTARSGDIEGSPRPSSARRKVITLHSDKTFSVHPQNISNQPLSTSSRADSTWSAQPSYTTRESSYGRPSIFSDDPASRPSSPLTPLSERSASRSPVSAAALLRSSSRTSAVSPWNYRMVGGLRKVPKTPDLKQKQPEVSGPSSELPLPPLPAELARSSSATVPPQSQQLTQKASFQSAGSSQSGTGTTLSERTNYKVYGQSSPIAIAELDSLPPSSSHFNYQILGGTSSDPSVQDQGTRPPTSDSDANFLVHAHSSAPSSVIATRSRVRQEFSRESLVVAPLRPTKRSSSDSLCLVRSRSADSLRTGSLTSLSTIFTQEATRALFVGPATMLEQVRPSSQDPSSSQRPRNAQYPHNWSSQLSTVFSESEGDSEPASRALSLASMAGRRSSGRLGSSHSRHMLSMYSALAGLEEHTGNSTPSICSSVETPPPVPEPTYSRDPNSGLLRLIRDPDEHGDGLTDLEELRHRPSRRHMNKMLSHYGSDRSLRSNSSFNFAAIPAWARLYYGSGERRWLAYKASTESIASMFSDFSDSQSGAGSQPGGLSRSPSYDRFMPNVYIPRRRPRQDAPQDAPLDPVSVRRSASNARSNAESMEIRPISTEIRPLSEEIRPLSQEIRPLSSHPVMNVVRSIKKKTSSVWSPHLARDRRPVQSSVWEPPTSDWEATSELAGRRNAQVAMFVVGFVIPFAWMIASFIPLYREPSHPELLAEQGQNTPKTEVQHDTSEDPVYTNAVWWRNVNRGMSVVGILIIAAVIILSVVGVTKGW